MGKNSSPAAAQVFSNSNLCTKLATTPVFPGEPPPSNPNGTPEPSQRTRERGQKRSTCAPKTPSWGRILPRGKTDRGTRGSTGIPTGCLRHYMRHYAGRARRGKDTTICRSSRSRREDFAGDRCAVCSLSSADPLPDGGALRGPKLEIFFGPRGADTTSRAAPA